MGLTRKDRQKGGKAVVRKFGRAYMRKIGKRGRRKQLSEVKH